MFDFIDRFIERAVTIHGREPLQVARTLCFYVIFGYFTGKFTKSVLRNGLKRTLMSMVFFLYKSYQGKKGMRKTLDDVRKQLIEDLIPKEIQNSNKNVMLPVKSIPQDDLIKDLKIWSAFEKRLWDGTGGKIVSGSVYHGGKKLQELQNVAYSLFSLSNPLHPETFPYIRKMESEVIAMTLNWFNGDVYKNCGLMTSGGTESIVLAIRAYKQWARAEKGIEYPELIIPRSAHAAFQKGCEMFGVKCIFCPIDGVTFQCDLKALRKLINKNTIAIVGSCIQYAQGVMDPIPEMSKIAIEHNIGLHIDSCLGSFLVASLDRLKVSKNLRPFDFRNPGVTTISCDTHKFGYSVKGTSVLMFKTLELRHYTYFTYEESSIGMYSTPTIAGSRCGGVIASTWTVMMNLGQEGYLESARNIWKAREICRKAIEETDGIELMGEPVSSVICFRTTNPKLNVFHVSGAMSARQWSLNNMQNPPCTHLTVTHCNYKKAEKFAQDIKDSVKDVLNNPQKYKKSGAAMYGTLVNLPDTTLKSDILKEYMDVMYWI